MSYGHSCAVCGFEFVHLCRTAQVVLSAHVLLVWKCLHSFSFIQVWSPKYMLKISFKSQKGDIQIFTLVFFSF